MVYLGETALLLRMNTACFGLWLQPVNAKHWQTCLPVFRSLVSFEEKEGSSSRPDGRLPPIQRVIGEVTNFKPLLYEKMPSSLRLVNEAEA